MFGNLKDIGKIMKMAGEAKERAAEMQAELERRTVTGESGGGAVRVTLNGKGRCLRIETDPALFAGLVGDDKDMAEDLIAAAFNDGMEKVQQVVLEETQKITGGLDLPGMDQMLGGS